MIFWLIGKNHVGGSDGKCSKCCQNPKYMFSLIITDTHAAKANGKLKTLLDAAGVKSSL